MQARWVSPLVAAALLTACTSSSAPASSPSPTIAVSGRALERTDNGRAILGYLRCEDIDCMERLQELVAKGRPVVPMLLVLLRPEALAAVVGDATLSRTRILIALGQIGDASAVPSVLQAGSDPDPVVRASAAGAIGKIASDRAVPDLTPFLRDTDSYVRETTAQALASLARREALPALRSALEVEPAPHVRSALEEAVRKSDR